MAQLPVVDDELDRLLGDVRKTIKENRQFLKALVDDSIDEVDDENDADGGTAEEDFEEL